MDILKNIRHSHWHRNAVITKVIMVGIKLSSIKGLCYSSGGVHHPTHIFQLEFWCILTKISSMYILSVSHCQGHIIFDCSWFVRKYCKTPIYYNESIMFIGIHFINYKILPVVYPDILGEIRRHLLITFDTKLDFLILLYKNT